MANIAKKVIPGNASESIYDIIKNALFRRSRKKLMQHIKVKVKFFSTPFLGWQLRDWRGLMFHFTKSDRVNAIIIHLLNIFVKKETLFCRYEQY